MTTSNSTPYVVTMDYDSEGNARIIKEERIVPQAPSRINMLEALRYAKMADGKTTKVNLYEAWLNNPDAANILRNDLKAVAFTAMRNQTRTYPMFTTIIDSDDMEEEYIRDAAMGAFPDYYSGDERKLMQSSFEGGAIITNVQKAGLVKVPMDWVRFDKLGKIRSIGQQLANSAFITDESRAYKEITTSGNFTRNSSTNDNDFGANTQNLTFNATNLQVARNIIGTSKDRKSGSYLGFHANMLIAGPAMEIPILQLLTSTQLQRQHGVTSAEITGTGTSNPLQGTIETILFNPWFGNSYGWALLDSRQESFVRQNVDGWNIFQETPTSTSEGYMTHDSIQYMMNSYWGLGFVDDRPWFLSTSTTIPTVS